MNHLLFDTYKKLSETEQAELRHKYKDSEVGLRLIGFLDQCTNRNYKNIDAVSFIYKDSSEEEYSVLENRYFKLRKKALDDLKDISTEESGKLVTEEEDILNQCWYLISTGDKKTAYKQLVELEKICWERNIFELLPSILDNLVFLNQSFNQVEKNKEIYVALEKALTLQYDINRAIMLTRQVYDIMITQGLKFAKKQFAGLKELADKNKDYPRFAMCYHHTSLYFKSSSPEYLDNQQVVSRHHADFKKLFAENPRTPLISYKPDYDKFTHFHFSQINTFYHNNRGEYEEAYEAMKDAWNMVHSSNSVFNRFKTEGLYFNMFTMQLITGRYRDALETCNMYVTFIKENGKTERLVFANMWKAALYVNAFPQIFKMDSVYLLEQTDEYIKAVKKHASIELPYHHALGYKSQLFIILGKYKEAKELIAKTEAGGYFKEMNSFELVNELLELLSKTHSEKQLLELAKKVQQRRMKANTPDAFMVLLWLGNYIQYLQKKKN
ncbi:MAG TPA: hypothetical protein VK806_05625 [Bacteroidia bacterium]|jgi:hypothetical protein|nr:hypothetical protein [Bacteroidia bacterium]